MSTTNVCVLRAGKDFTPEHVQWLAAQVPGLVCLSDQPVPGVPTIALRRQWPGWWSKMEAFDAALIAGDVLLIDLDTVVFDLPALPRATTVLSDFYRPHLMGSGFIFVTAADRARCWHAFTTAPQRHMQECVTRERWGDQGFLHPLIGHRARWGSEVRSYKVHCQHGVPAGTRVVCFHGRPRPWEVAADWVPQFPADLLDLRTLSDAGERVIPVPANPIGNAHSWGAAA
jgi:hypothetical protein